MGNGHGEKMSRMQDRAIAALLSASTIGDAARAVGIGERTLREWMKVPAFRLAYQDARRELIATAIGRLQAGAGVAVDALVEVARHGRPSERIRAASVLLTHARMGVELPDEPEPPAARAGPPVAQTVDGRRAALLELMETLRLQAQQASSPPGTAS